jgi:hypothetical protein
MGLLELCRRLSAVTMSSAVLRERRCCISIEAAKGNYIRINPLSELILNLTRSKLLWLNTCVLDCCCFDVALFIHNAGTIFTKVQLLASTAFADDKGSCLQQPNKDTKDQRLLAWRK